MKAFLDRLTRDPLMQARVQSAVTADEVANLAQALGYSVSGNYFMMLSLRSPAGFRVTRIQLPGE